MGVPVVTSSVITLITSDVSHRTSLIKSKCQFWNENKERRAACVVVALSPPCGQRVELQPETLHNGRTLTPPPTWRSIWGNDLREMTRPLFNEKLCCFRFFLGFFASRSIRVILGYWAALKLSSVYVGISNQVSFEELDTNKNGLLRLFPLWAAWARSHVTGAPPAGNSGVLYSPGDLQQNVFSYFSYINRYFFVVFFARKLFLKWV